MQYIRDFNTKFVRRGEQNRIIYDQGGRFLESIHMGGWTVYESDLMLLWSSEDRNWEQKLNTIKVNPNAGRAPRNHFCELNRLICDNDTMFVTMEMLRQKVLKMTRIPVDLKTDSPPMLHDPEHQLLIRLNEKSRIRARIKHAQVLRYGLWWLEQEHQTVKEYAWFDKLVFNKSQTHLLLLDKPSVPAIRIAFSKMPKIKKVCLIPSFHVRKENALFVFERGSKWSLERNAIYPD